MFDKYKYFFDLYLRICESMYNPENPYENLEECVKACNARSWELFGMLQLLKVADEIEDSVYEAEMEKVMKKFSSIRICNAYMEDGQVMVFVGTRDEYLGSSDNSCWNPDMNKE